MTMEPIVCPPFEESTRRFQKLLFANGWLTEIVCMKTDERLEPLPPAEVTREFEFAGIGASASAFTRFA